MVDKIKHCTRCTLDLPVSEFCKGGPKSADGLSFWCKKCSNKHNKEYRQNNRHVTRNAYYLNKYGITLEEYDRLFAAQGGLCAICKRPENGRLAVDHCHETTKVRGLLCKKCNQGLGLFNESASALYGAIQYLAREVI